jgi:hypothetical protein
MSDRESGQVRVIKLWFGSALGSAGGTRTAACCRFLAEICRVGGRRNSLSIRVFRRAMSRAVADVHRHMHAFDAMLNPLGARVHILNPVGRYVVLQGLVDTVAYNEFGP